MFAHFTQLLQEPAFWMVIGGFSLFGSSGDKSTSQSTTNVTNDTTTANSHNVATNTANTLNAALTNNNSYIKNDSLVQNTALQLTDAFNRISNYNLANVGNTTVGSAAPGVNDYAAFFKAAPQGKVNQSELDLSKPLLDFNTLSGLNTSQLEALSKLTGSVQMGQAANVAATAGSLTAAKGGNGGLSGTWLVVLAGLAALVVFLLLRRK